MKLKLFFTAIMFSTFVMAAFAQTDHSEMIPARGNESENDVPFVSVQQMPEFPGGESELFNYIAKSIVYPETAIKNGIEGKVFVYFIIDKEGKVKNAEVKRGVKNGEMLNAEALRVINSMPQWKPGYQNNKPASVQFTVPVDFKLAITHSNQK